MARAIRDARFRMLPGGHLLPLDDPGAFSAALAAFFAEAPA
jgi:pimeloyl-ACP methyl ester carboxylesterase